MAPCPRPDRARRLAALEHRPERWLPAFGKSRCGTRAWRIVLDTISRTILYGHTPGLSLALFLAALAAAVPLTNTVQRDGRTRRVALALLVLGILPLLESVSLLSILFGAAGLVVFAVLMTGGCAPGWPATLAAAGRMLVAGPLQIAPDLTASLRRSAAASWRWRRESVIGWVVPFLLCSLFAALFVSANPLIDAWLAAISWSALWPQVAFVRIVAWLLLAALAWPFVAVRRRYPTARSGTSPEAPESAAAPVGPGGLAALLGLTPAVIRRCLVLFNLLFAVQSVLDILFLWGGVALPDGFTYAAYAHRGAYPLIATALLAAAFVLITMGPDGPGERSAAIRRLVHLWIAQNVLLVVSAILRLDLYVAAYSLTLVRAAAFIWMGLVAAGLLLIVTRIALRRSNGWLVAANAAVLAATLYACAFVNVSALIAGYNVAHSREFGGEGGAFDIGYAMDLGPAAIPAVDRYIAVATGTRLNGAVTWRVRNADRSRQSMQAWRRWTFRGWRLTQYLDEHPSVSPGPPTPMFNPTDIR